MADKGSDKRSVSTDALETLGTVPLDDRQKRDAIHLAVEPVVAGERMGPGDHITVINGVAWRADKDDEDKPLGIVDPFLPRAVRKGERFWFVMYPRMVHSLRHVWTHPAFTDEPVVAESESDAPTSTKVKQSLGAQIAESERWLRDFCDRSHCPDYDTVMAVIAANSTAFDSDYLHIYDHDASGEIPAEFWDHAEIVLGRKIAKRPSWFSCSC